MDRIRKNRPKLVPLPWKEGDPVPDAPPKEERVVGQRYNYRGHNRLWQGRKWYCIHVKPVESCDTCESSRTNLKDSHPELIPQWSPDNPPMETVSTSSHIKVKWVCNEGHSWITSPNQRTNRNSGCPKCSKAKFVVVDPMKKAELQNKSNRRQTTQIGDESERFIEDLLIKKGGFLRVERIGHTGDKTDIIVQLTSGELKSCQVKTLTQNHHNDTFYMTNNHKYPSDMLMVMVSKDRTKFALEFAGNIQVKRLTLTFGCSDSKYHDIMFQDQDQFVKRFIELIPRSSTMIENNSQSNNKELEMLKRLQEFCTRVGLTFKRNDTNGDAIDVFINEIPVQCKFRSFNSRSSETFDISSLKASGRICGHSIKQPYSATDGFDYMVVEVGGTIEAPQKYLGQFCFIPLKELIEQKILAQGDSPGKKAFYICAPDTKKTTHWSFPYWNNYHPLICRIPPQNKKRYLDHDHTNNITASEQSANKKIKTI